MASQSQIWRSRFPKKADAQEPLALLLGKQVLQRLSKTFLSQGTFGPEVTKSVQPMPEAQTPRKARRSVRLARYFSLRVDQHLHEKNLGSG